MNTKQFLQEVGSIKGWKMDCGRMRLDTETGQYCPITAVAKKVLNEDYRVDEWMEAGCRLGLYPTTSYMISCAADNNWVLPWSWFFKRKLRKIVSENSIDE